MRSREGRGREGRLEERDGESTEVEEREGRRTSSVEQNNGRDEATGIKSGSQYLWDTHVRVEFAEVEAEVKTSQVCALGRAEHIPQQAERL